MSHLDTSYILKEGLQKNERKNQEMFDGRQIGIYIYIRSLHETCNMPNMLCACIIWELFVRIGRFVPILWFQ